MQKDQHAKEELEGLSPLLSKMRSSSEQGLDIPQNFFEQLPDEVMRKIKLEDQHAAAHAADSTSGSGWLSWLFPVAQPRLALAFATVLILVVAAIFTLRPDTSSEQVLANTELSAEDWQAYISQNIDEFDSELLWQAASEDKETNDAPIDDSNLYMDELLDEVSDEDLEEFFM